MYSKMRNIFSPTKRPLVDYMDMICDDGKVCTLSYEFLASCVIYIKDDEHPNCEVPCHMEHCKQEQHFYINCPVYFCSFGPTTLTPSPTSPTTLPPSPTPSPTPSGSSHSGYATSVAFNVICVAVFGALIGKKYLKKRNGGRNENPIIRHSSGIVNPLYEETEREPLLARINFRRNRSRTQDIALSGFQAAEARFIEASETGNEPETLSDFAELDLEAAQPSAAPFPSRSLADRLKSVFGKN